MIAILEGKRPERSRCKREITPTAWRVMTECWDADPTRRLTARDAAIRLETLSQYAKRAWSMSGGFATPDSYLSMPSPKLPRRRSLEELQGSASASSNE